MKHILRLAIVALSLSAEQARAEISYGDILAEIVERKKRGH